MSHKGKVTELLIAWSEGEDHAMDRLLPLVYDELRRLAAHCLRPGGSTPTLNPTALVHEAWMRLADDKKVEWQNRAHFFALSARIMRGLMVDHARARSRQKRGGHFTLVSLENVPEIKEEQLSELIALDDALEKLSQMDPQQADIVTFRFFGGLSDKEIAAALEISTATVTRRWRVARAWLHTELGGT